jgi:hypothetical protein
MEHFDSFTADANLVEQLFQKLDAPFGVGITFQVMTRSFQSAGDHNAVCTILKRLEHVQHIKFASAGQQHNTHIRRVLYARRTREIGGGIRTIVATKCNQLWFKAIGCTHTCCLSSKTMV